MDVVCQRNRELITIVINTLKPIVQDQRCTKEVIDILKGMYSICHDFKDLLLACMKGNKFAWYIVVIATVQYVIKRGIVDNIDYNMDGVIDDLDDIVVKMVDGKEVARRPLNEPVRDRIINVLEKDRRLSMKGENQDMQRMLYQRMPSANVENPPPVVIKQESSFGEYVKMGAGEMTGRLAVYSVFNILAGMFSNGGAKAKKTSNRRR